MLFVAVPLLELFILIRLGGAIGLMPTLALCVFTGFAGAWLTRREGLRALWSFQARVAKGGLPGRSLMDGLCILVGGALLLTPGLLTDLLGFALLLPPSRRWIQTRMQREIERKLADGSLRVTTFGAHPGAGGAHPGAGTHSGAGGAHRGIRTHPGASGEDRGGSGADRGAGGASAWRFGSRSEPAEEVPRSRPAPGEIIQRGGRKDR